jgi:hypothetical protein
MMPLGNQLAELSSDLERAHPSYNDIKNGSPYDKQGNEVPAQKPDNDRTERKDHEDRSRDASTIIKEKRLVASEVDHLSLNEHPAEIRLGIIVAGIIVRNIVIDLAVPNVVDLASAHIDCHLHIPTRAILSGIIAKNATLTVGRSISRDPSSIRDI